MISPLWASEIETDGLPVRCLTLSPIVGVVVGTRVERGVGKFIFLIAVPYKSRDLESEMKNIR